MALPSLLVQGGVTRLLIVLANSAPNHSHPVASSAGGEALSTLTCCATEVRLLARKTRDQVGRFCMYNGR